MKRITSIILSIVMLASMAVLCIPASAEATSTTANYYEWNFDDASLNDTANGVFTANSGNNTLTVKTPTDLTVANAVNTYLTGSKATAGYSVKAATQSNGTKVYTELGNALYVCDRYLDFGTDIHLDCDKEWKIEITGNIPKGGISNNGSNGIGKTALFAGETKGDHIFVDGGNRAFYLYDNYPTNSAFSVQTSNTTVDSAHPWSSDARIGQQRDQKLVIENVKLENGEHRIRWSIVESYNYPNDAWNGGIQTWNNNTTNRDFVFEGIGSNTYYITANPSSTNGYNPFFSSIKIWEDTSVTMEGFQTRTSTTAQSDSADVRMLSLINGTDAYMSAGFVVSKSNPSPVLGGENVTDYKTKTVYTSISVSGDEHAAVDGYYYVPLVIENIPNAKFNETIYVRSYVIDTEGNITYGNLCSFKVADLLS